MNLSRYELIQKAFIFLLISISMELLPFINGQRNRRLSKIQDASFYPGKEKGSLKISFSNFGDFSNLEAIKKKEGFLGFGLFCIKRGAFIVYNQPDYQVENTEQIRIVSGENRCIKPFNVRSSQPIGPIDQPKQDSITFFSRPIFASLARPTSTRVKESFFATMKSSVKSLIIIGRTPWRIKTKSGKRFCLMNKGLNSDKSPICLLPNVNQTAINSPGINIVSVKRGCRTNNSIIAIPLTFCTYWGQTPIRIEQPSSTDDDVVMGGMKGRSSLDGCDSVGDSAIAMNETLMLFKTVLANTFDELVIVHIPGLGKLKWKLELLDLIFDIAKAAIPNGLISDSYMNRIRELFIYSLEKTWLAGSKDGADKGTKTEDGGAGDSDTVAGDARLHMLTEYDFRGMLFQTGECLESVDDATVKANLGKWDSIDDPDDVTEMVWSGLRRKKGANIIIEMTWLITNMVGGICHQQFKFAHNYWALYIHIVNNMYLTPMVPHWYSKIPHLDIILGGDMELQYNKLALFTSLSLFTSNSLEPFQRPKENDETTITENPAPTPPMPDEEADKTES